MKERKTINNASNIEIFQILVIHSMMAKKIHNMQLRSCTHLIKCTIVEILCNLWFEIVETSTFQIVKIASFSLKCGNSITSVDGRNSILYAIRNETIKI